MTDPIIIKRLEVHQNPENKREWAISFIFDEEGKEGDIVETGSKKYCNNLLTLWSKLDLVGLEQSVAMAVIHNHKIYVDRTINSIKSLEEIGGPETPGAYVAVLEEVLLDVQLRIKAAKGNKK